MFVAILALKSNVFIVPSWEPDISQVGSTRLKQTLFTVRLWSTNTCSCFEREGLFKFQTTTAPFVAAVARIWSVNEKK